MAAIFGVADREGPTAHLDAQHGSGLGNCRGVHGSLQRLYWTHHGSLLPRTLRSRLPAAIHLLDWTVVSSCRATDPDLHLEWHERYSNNGGLCCLIRPGTYSL